MARTEGPLPALQGDPVFHLCPLCLLLPARETQIGHLAEDANGRGGPCSVSTALGLVHSSIHTQQLRKCFHWQNGFEFLVFPETEILAWTCDLQCLTHSG